MMKIVLHNKAIIFLLLLPGMVFSQGRAHQFLFGYVSGPHPSAPSTRARMLFDPTGHIVQPDSFKMKFSATQGNISDESGNLLMVSNGIWIMDASGDTMMNGSGLNPNSFTDDWTFSGLPLSHGNLIVPDPGDSDQYVMFHQTGNYDAGLPSTELYYSVIDISLNNGLGAVVSKNNIIILDTLFWGIAACRHGNGRDWWVVSFRDFSDTIYSVLYTSSGLYSTVKQSSGVPATWNNAAQPTFSPDGTKLCYSSGYRMWAGGPWYHDIRLFDFDRCTGIISNPRVIVVDSSAGFGLAWSPDSKYIYTSSFYKIYQYNSDTSDVASSEQLVAVFDGYYSNWPGLYTDFWLMYGAADGRIYISSGNSVQELHVIASPDSGGVACNVQQHSIPMPCWTGRGNVNHPNYYLGPVKGSICDSLGIGMPERGHDFRLGVMPNPAVTMVKVIYLLPENKGGVLEMVDVTGRVIYSTILAPWSTLQYIDVSGIPAGVYAICIRSEEKCGVARVVVE